MSTHKAIATTAKGVLEEIHVPTQEPQEFEVLIKNEYCAAVALDVYATDMGRLVDKYPYPLGLNASGVVVKVGPYVNNLNVGDRVASFAIASDLSGKSMQEYSLLTKYCVTKIPKSLSFQEAATIPDNFMSAYCALFGTLQLHLPISLPSRVTPTEASTPILVYGSGSAVGQYTIQLLSLAGYTRIFATASAKHHEHLKSLGATHTFDYSQPDLVKKILAETHGQPFKYAVDCIAAETTLNQVAKLVGKESIVAMFVPIKEGSAIVGAPGFQIWMEIPKDRISFPEGVQVRPVLAFGFLQNVALRETVLPIILHNLLSEGLLKPVRARLIDGATFKQRVTNALDLLRNNKISGEKAVIKVSD